ncbi:hydroxymethylglutaryl-CoA lyase [Sinorhizobium medicae]|uniref:hydroxymethylglutaryl-CoA lyase n=1 Tax=Sinorhizobium medicae TaxID=110321 RepID=UPI000FDB0090|nr:hydroxymethylglutaryl-CoA lyase [Sinorhizobium medicae]RVO73556.1 hydroxymethylglutaryl-CoA lyase [Sinorhizobium medicae]
MSDFPKHITVYEEGPREAFQSEPVVIQTADKIRLIEALSRTGVRHIQCTSFVDPRRVPGMADAAEVMAGLTRVEAVEYSALWMNTRGLQQALNVPYLKVDGKVRIYPSQTFLRQNMGRTPADHRAKNVEMIELCKELGVPVTQASVASAFGCNFQGDIELGDVLRLVAETFELFQEHGLRLEELSLADTMAWATPDAVTRYLGALRDAYPDLNLRLHLHDTRGMGLANAYAGLQMGVIKFDSSVGGLGGCPFANHKSAAGNICTEDFVHMCHELGINTGIDLEALIDAARFAAEIVGHPLSGRVTAAGTLSEVRRRKSAKAAGSW